jgi:hypothetical protein
MASIFVQIASYQDFELPKTVIDAVEKSSGNHVICFGVHNCVVENHQIFIPMVPNFRMQESQAPENIGVGLGRSIANSLYNGQDYYLQVDGHTRFYDNWDEELIRNILEMQAQGIKKPLLSAYPSSYSYNNNLKEHCDWDRSVTSISFAEKPEQFEQTLIPSQLAKSLSVSAVLNSAVVPVTVLVPSEIDLLLKVNVPAAVAAESTPVV